MIHLLSRSASLRSLGLVLVGVVLGILATPLAEPAWKETVMAVGAKRYQELVYLCDSAMREHYIARARAAEDPTDASISELSAAEIALIDCQDYDLFQKRLMQWGLSENELSVLRLQAIESGGGSLEEVVRFHEIRD